MNMPLSEYLQVKVGFQQNLGSRPKMLTSSYFKINIFLGQQPFLEVADLTHGE